MNLLSGLIQEACFEYIPVTCFSKRRIRIFFFYLGKLCYSNVVFLWRDLFYATVGKSSFLYLNHFFIGCAECQNCEKTSSCILGIVTEESPTNNDKYLREADSLTVNSWVSSGENLKEEFWCFQTWTWYLDVFGPVDHLPATVCNVILLGNSWQTNVRSLNMLGFASCRLRLSLW